LAKRRRRPCQPLLCSANAAKAAKALPGLSRRLQRLLHSGSKVAAQRQLSGCIAAAQRQYSGSKWWQVLAASGGGGGSS
jgi:hypothetical protein